MAGAPSASGKAQFSVSAQLRGGCEPPGRLARPCRRGPDARRPRALDWLVVTGDTARLAGRATVGGAAGYRFEATATDAATDTMRLVVRDASGAVVYDSGTQRVQGQVKLH